MLLSASYVPGARAAMVDQLWSAPSAKESVTCSLIKSRDSQCERKSRCSGSGRGRAGLALECLQIHGTSVAGAGVDSQAGVAARGEARVTCYSKSPGRASKNWKDRVAGLTGVSGD